MIRRGKKLELGKREFLSGEPLKGARPQTFRTPTATTTPGLVRRNLGTTPRSSPSPRHPILPPPLSLCLGTRKVHFLDSLLRRHELLALPVYPSTLFILHLNLFSICFFSETISRPFNLWRPLSPYHYGDGFPTPPPTASTSTPRCRSSCRISGSTIHCLLDEHTLAL